ncbi:MAG: HAMP domain-containing histidine kinase [Phycisphaerales bacterium]|nr:HAMP domain-containing histidine kinase [Planctomycetota bacterium]MCH8509578.1 HAMP domain-containing histidine kinase [Phycisphaerales bacterium]
MNARRPVMWWVFWAGAIAVVGALAWASLSVSRLEHRNQTNRELAQRQEAIRLALWRVDSQLAPIIAMEAARSPGDGVSSFADARRGAAPQRPAPFVEGFFSVDALRNIDASDPKNRAIGDRLINAPQHAAESEPEHDDARKIETELAFDYQVRRQVADLAQSVDPAASPPARARTMHGEAEEPQREAAESPPLHAFTAADEPARVGASESLRLEPRWVETEPDRLDLVLVRNIPTDAGTRTEGVTMDWAGLRDTLERSVQDLIPGATLVPAHGTAAGQIERDGRGFRLATVPALLIPGDFAPSPPARMTPALWALLITWIATLGALAAVGLVLRATMRLSDRRARFVGAVTHELRTPLTTFRLYAQMLAGGMVTDEKAQAEYLGTLERESIRLGEIVENVLEYARLTRRRPGAARPPGERSVSASELLARVRPVLSRRAEQSGMDLIVSAEPPIEAEPRPTVTCDPRSVERILMNLVENACKYALPSDEKQAEDADTRIHLDLSVSDRHLEILVADHGRGIPRRERERVFGEFQRGPGAAEGSRPGLGLGLALSRGLAREMGGDLRLVRRRAHGAEFLLTIPLDPPASTAPPTPR